MSAWVSPITWTNGAVTASQMNVGIRDKMNWLKDALSQNGITSDTANSKLTSALVGARVYRTTSQAITTGTAGSLLTGFNTERFDSDGFHAASASDFVIPAGMAGYYLIGASVSWEGNTTGARRLGIYTLPSASLIAQTMTPTTTAIAFKQTVSTFWQCAVGDTFEVQVAQTSGGNLNIDPVLADSPEFWIARLFST